MSLTNKQQRMLARARQKAATFADLKEAGGYVTVGHAENALRKLLEGGYLRRASRQKLWPLTTYEAVET